MAEEIKRDEIASKDVFDNIIKGAEQAEKVLRTMNEQLKEVVANNAKMSKQAANVESYKQLKEAEAGIKATNLAFKESLKLQQEEEKVKQARIRTEKMLQQEQERQLKQKERENKAQQQANSAYSQASKRLNELRKEYKDLAFQGKENTQRAKELVQQVQALDKELKRVDATVGQHQRNVGNYSGALETLDAKLAEGNLSLREMNKLMKEYQTIAINAGSESAIGREAIERAAALKDEIGDIQARTRILSSDTVKLDTAIAAVGLGASAFQGIQSAMALAGVENEKLMQTMVKLQAVQGLANSINQIAIALNKDNILGIQLRIAIERIKARFIAQSTAAQVANTAATAAGTAATGAATTATTALGVAMKALPLFAIIAGITAVVGAIIYFNSESKNAKESVEDLNNAIEDLTASHEFLGKAVSDYSTIAINEAKARGASAKELLKLEIQAAQDKINAEWELLSETVRINKRILKNENATAEQIIAASEAIYQSEKRFIELRREAKVAASEFNLKLAEIENKREEDLENKRKKRVEDAKKRLEEWNKILVAYYDAIEAERQRNLEGEEKELQEAADRFDKLVEIADKARQSTVELTEKYEKEITAIQEKYRLIREEADRQANNKKELLMKSNAVLEEELQMQLALNEAESEEERVRIRKLYSDKLMQLKIEEIEKQKEIDLQNTKLTEEERFAIINKAELEIAKLRERTLEQEEDLNAKRLLKEAEQAAERNKIIASSTDFFQKKIDQQIEAQNKLIENSKALTDQLKAQAAQGNIDAQNSLATQQKLQDQAEKKKIQLERRKKQLELASAYLSAFNSELASGKSVQEALLSAGATTSVLSAFVDTLASYDVGTDEIKVDGKGVDGKGGTLAVVHDGEKIFTKDENRAMGNKTRAEIVDIVKHHDAVDKHMITRIDRAPIIDFTPLLSEIKELKSEIKNRPVTESRVGEITSTMMTIIDSKRTPNKVVNRKFNIRP